MSNHLLYFVASTDIHNSPTVSQWLPCKYGALGTTWCPQRKEAPEQKYCQPPHAYFDISKLLTLRQYIR